MTATCFTGFAFTYFGPLLAGTYSPVPPTVHLHGWSFFLWYLLLPAQALLVRFRRLALHRGLGLASVGLAMVMVASGLVVASVQIHRASGPQGSPFWSLFGLGILSTLVVFAVFYGLAIRHRRKPALHRRFMILAGAGGLGAAAFRILGAAFGGGTWTVPGGILVTALFVVAAMIHDRRSEGRVHPAYAWGLGGMLGLSGGALLLPVLGLAGPLNRMVGALGRVLEALYQGL